MSTIETDLLPKTENIQIRKGATWNQAWAVTNNGDPQSMDGCTSSLRIYDKNNGTLLLECTIGSGLTVEGVDDDNIRVNVDIDIAVGTWKWEHLVTLADGFKFYNRKGTFLVEDDLTPNA